MADKNLPWFRFYTEAMNDRKFPHAARLCGASRMEIMGAWALILCAAGESPVRGALYVTLQKRYSNDDVTDLLGCDEERARKIMDAFVEMEMLEVVDGAYHVKNWDKRQYKSDSSAARVQNYRQKATCNADVTLHDRYSNVSVTPPEDTDTESDSEKESSAATAGVSLRAGETGEVFRAIENEIGTLSPMMVDTVKALIAEYPTDWIMGAVKEAVKYNKRGIRYVEEILKRWRVDGPYSEKKPAYAPRNGATSTPVRGKVVDTSELDAIIRGEIR